MNLKPGWLTRTLRDVAADYATWPAWMKRESTMPITPPCPGCGRIRRVPAGMPIVCECYCPGTKEYGKRMAAVLRPIGTRKPGVPSQDEVYRDLKERSIELQSVPEVIRDQRTKSQEKRIRAQQGLDPVPEPVPEVRFRLIQDDDCHWYVIRTNQVEEFGDWQKAMVECQAWKGHDFGIDAIGGCPGQVTFPSFRMEV